MNCVCREDRSVLLVDERRGEAGRQEGRERASERAGGREKRRLARHSIHGITLQQT